MFGSRFFYDYLVITLLKIMEHSFIANPHGTAVAVVFRKVGDSLQPQTSEASQLITINNLQKEKVGKQPMLNSAEKAKLADLKQICEFSDGSTTGGFRIQPTQEEKKKRKLLKQHYVK